MRDDLLNVLDLGADPSGVNESTQAFRDALEKSRTVFVPHGTYKLSGMIIGEMLSLSDIADSPEEMREGLPQDSNGFE